MSFDRRDIRPGMGVYTLDGAYVGDVLRTGMRARVPSARSPAEPAATGSSISGESLGPAPTARIGNSGPGSQAAAARYATTTDESPAGAVNWLDVAVSAGRQRRFSVDLVQAVSMERVVLAVRAFERGPR